MGALRIEFELTSIAQQNLRPGEGKYYLCIEMMSNIS